MKFNIAAIAIALHSATASTTTNTQLNKLHAIAKIEVIRSASTSKALDADYIDRPAQRPPPGARAKIPVPANDPKVVGGSDATPGEYPFMVMVGSNGLLSCGGSLVSPNTVLCAAHCFSAAQQVYIGRHDISVSNEIGAETFNVIEAVMHPSYSPNTINNDYMMLKLSGNSTYTPIALDDGTLSPNFIGGEDLQLIGWGRIFGGGPISPILQEVELDYLTNAQCAGFWGNLITDKMLCVNRAGKSACNGDSGSPLFVYDETGATPPIQMGIVSWGSIDCIGTPTVFARVSEEIDWINYYIDLWSGDSGSNPTPSPPGNCTNDPNFVDSFEDDCDWYEENDPTCSVGDCCDAGFGTANEACCICGGGIMPPSTPTPSSPDPGVITCTNDPNFIDSFEDDCSWYEQDERNCHYGDCCEIGFGTANQACCICGGGTVVTPAPVTPAPVATPSGSPTLTPELNGTVQDAIDLIHGALDILEHHE